jgi:hypothetical protein
MSIPHHSTLSLYHSDSSTRETLKMHEGSSEEDVIDSTRDFDDDKGVHERSHVDT